MGMASNPLVMDAVVVSESKMTRKKVDHVEDRKVRIQDRRRDLDRLGFRDRRCCLCRRRR